MSSLIGKATGSYRNDLTLNVWNKSWDENFIPWHADDVNVALKDNLERLLDGKKEQTIFVPLCGKTIDMKWLYDLGHIVIGVESSSKAITEFFNENKLEFERDENLFSTADKRLRLFSMDLFECTTELLGKVDAVWDRGSFVAINYSDREKYVTVMKKLLKQNGRYLLDVYEYDVKEYSGPPLCVLKEEVDKYFSRFGKIEKVYEFDMINDRWRNVGLTAIIRFTYLIYPN